MVIYGSSKKNNDGDIALLLQGDSGGPLVKWTKIRSG